MTNRAIIGNTNRVVDKSKQSSLVFEPNELAFQPMASYLTALHGFLALVDVYNEPGGARPWAHDDVMLFDAVACDLRLEWNPLETVWPMTKNGWPPKIEFAAYEAEPVQSEGEARLGVMDHYIFGLGQALITNFVESQKATLKREFGAVTNWPSVWNFARVVRNAMSHGGAIRITDGAQVEWRRLRYAEADNGRRIINADLLPADLFLLIKEMEAALP